MTFSKPTTLHTLSHPHNAYQGIIQGTNSEAKIFIKLTIKKKNLEDVF
jgi:hypothetical protein